MVSVNEVVRVNPPPVPITVIGYEPGNTEDEVVIMHVLVNFGFPEPGLKDTMKANAMPVVPMPAERVTV